MPGILQRKLHSTVRNSAAESLETIAEHAHEVLETWQERLRTLNLDAQVLIPEGVDFRRFARNLRGSAYLAFRQHIQEFGEKLAQRCDRLDHVVAAFNGLFEACLPYLAESTATAVLALARLHAQVGPLLISGYTGHGATGEQALIEASLYEPEDCFSEPSADVSRIYEHERNRLSQSLHDEVGHDLILAKLYLEMLVLEAKECPAVQPRLAEAIVLVSHAIDSVRRIGLDLAPAIFDELGFLPAVQSYISQFSARTRIPVSLRQGHIPEQIRMTRQIAVYRLIQGALTNVLQHSSATKATVSLGSTEDGVLLLVIEDDGVGFDAERSPGPRSVGLTAMRDRVEALGGRIHIRSERAGPGSKRHGTRIEIELPLPGGGGS